MVGNRSGIRLRVSSGEESPDSIVREVPGRESSPGCCGPDSAVRKVPQKIYRHGFAKICGKGEKVGQEPTGLIRKDGRMVNPFRSKTK